MPTLPPSPQQSQVYGWGLSKANTTLAQLDAGNLQVATPRFADVKTHGAWWMDPEVQKFQDDYGQRMHEILHKKVNPFPAIDDVKEARMEAGQKPLNNAQLMVEVLGNHPEWPPEFRQQFCDYMCSAGRGAKIIPRLRNYPSPQAKIPIKFPEIIIHPEVLADLKGDFKVSRGGNRIEKRKGHVPFTVAEFTLGGVEIRESRPADPTAWMYEVAADMAGEPLLLDRDVDIREVRIINGIPTVF